MVVRTPRAAFSRESWLQRFFSTFPNRWPGVGLGLLRGLVGATAIVQALAVLGSAGGSPIAIGVASVLAIASGLCLLAGLLTPAAAILTAASLLCLSPAPGGLPFVTAAVGLYLAAVSAAIVLLGPGAWSVDARLFGRREIVFPQPPPSRS